MSKPKQKVAIIDGNPVVVDYGKDFAEFTMYSHGGAVNVSSWAWHSNDKKRNLKIAGQLLEMVEFYIEKVEAMEVRKDG